MIPKRSSAEGGARLEICGKKKLFHRWGWIAAKSSRRIISRAVMVNKS
jgi:hypothetical protein